ERIVLYVRARVLVVERVIEFGLGAKLPVVKMHGREVDAIDLARRERERHWMNHVLARLQLKHGEPVVGIRGYGIEKDAREPEPAIDAIKIVLRRDVRRDECADVVHRECG